MPNRPASPEQPALLLTVEQARQRLCLGRTSLYSALADGRLEARKVGRRTLITAESVTRFVAAAPVAQFGASRTAA